MRATGVTQTPPSTGSQRYSGVDVERRAVGEPLEHPREGALALADHADVGVQVLHDRARHHGEAGAAEHDRRVAERRAAPSTSAL